MATLIQSNIPLMLENVTHFIQYRFFHLRFFKKNYVEAPGIDPGTSRMLWIFLLAEAYRFTIMQTIKYDANFE
jgi:hypothetical protein